MSEQKFIGRERELAALEEMYNASSFQMMIIYGRRRIGKTTLINQFCSDKDPLFYTGIEEKEEENRSGFSAAAVRHFLSGSPDVTFASYSDLLHFITSQIRSDSSGKRHVIVMDEYPYIAKASPEFSSVLQREIDIEWQKLNIMLILCGSSVTFMEDEVLSSKSPLFGRRTGQIDLRPFDYLTSSLFTPEYSPEEKAVIFGITGGIPKYLSLIRPDTSLQDNIIRLFFSASGYFYEEPGNMLREEFRDIPLYHSILFAIANGNSQVADICSKTGLDSPVVVPALKKLIAVRLIRKEYPILGKKNKRLHRYILSDGMFRFWFRFVRQGISAIERGYGSDYFERAVLPYLHDFMGPVFKEICQDYTFRTSFTGRFGIMLTEIGKWRGSDPVEKCQTDIDVVGIDFTTHSAVIGECKFKNELFGKKEMDTLKDRARLLSDYSVRYYLLFSLSGFSSSVISHCTENPEFIPVTMDDLYLPD